MGYEITSYNISGKTLFLLKQGDKIIAKGNSKQSVAKVLLFILGI